MTCRSSLLLAVALLFAPAVQADLTLVGRSTQTSLNLTNQGREALYVKKNMMRRDVTERGRSYSYLYDLAKKEVTVIDHFQRLVERHTLATRAAGKNAGPRVDLKPTGRSHALADWNCVEYDLNARLPADTGKEKMTLVLGGQVWLERRVSERREVAPFIKAVDADDFFVGSATPGQPGNAQSQGINEVMRQVLFKGMLCAAEIQLNYEGDGPMADLGRRMATHAGIVYDSVSDAAIGDEMFAIPAGYRNTGG
ncbi:hypothetical protein EZJ19_08950 [Parasulfuritortus cantonensis]|uniref:DUF4412 domain-containing protein n=1 Tax=Parasulfuritortus cantonensis TaxID=2528202 RepID=A0A4R1BCG9_9PROT|nr:hypothetical protein [Parasulfuritortus cantonensis]TCJ14704.1 hypothetical protein EZJ19_08950 [Parasulfuritortus cantonensis]